ncbi:MAG: hypothetical protein JXA46_16170 [Dehalococcoidales bacterium]|nr:hypothetical protein [Dehalococcoidales bacterium]
MGYRVEGQQAFIDIALFYPDQDEALQDSEEIVTRMRSYLFYTQYAPQHKPAIPIVPLTDLYEAGEPQIRTYEEGSVLKITCRLVPEGRKGMSPLMHNRYGARDLLFLVPDPWKYVAE